MKTFISFKEALDLTLSHVAAGKTESLPLDQLNGKILAADIQSIVDCPSISTSRKDGYAAISADVSEASKQNPVKLNIVGSMTAGDMVDFDISRGQAARVTTGAALPESADAVISEEFCQRSEESADILSVHNTAAAGRNILECGADIKKGELVARNGEKLSPAMIGLLASAGHDKAPVYHSPKVAVIATGDEVIAPGNPLSKGKLYASNMIELCAWLAEHRFSYTAELVNDSKTDIRAAITGQLPVADVFITSGGAWGSERDLIIKVAESLNWRGVYHRVRMGPGKPVGFGLIENKPIFILPGGPPSNEMAFLQLALPALLKIRGEPIVVFPVVQARLSDTVHGHKDWTDFIHAHLDDDKGQLIVRPAKLKSRLQSMARKEALISIPENRDEITAGERVEIQILEMSKLSYLSKGEYNS